jgi:glucosylceramidase
MKTNNSYVGKNGHLKQDPQTLAAYALYFSKYVQAYRVEGIPVQGIFPQNEPTEMRANYPQCGWNGKELNGFIRDYLVPRLSKDQVKVEVGLGTLARYNTQKGMDDYINPVLEDASTNPMVTGVGGQYTTQNLFQQTHDKYPDKKILQTETECYNGQNSWAQAMQTFDHVIADFNHFANGYMFWNMILSEKATSSRGWRQNSLIIVDTKKQKIVYNPEFYAMKHFGNLVRPGAVRIRTEGPSSDVIAFQNPSSECVVCFSNRAVAPATTKLQLNGRVVTLEVPGLSMNSVILQK